MFSIKIKSEYDLSDILTSKKIKFTAYNTNMYTLDQETTIQQVHFLANHLNASVSDKNGEIVLSVKVPFELWMLAVDMEIQKTTGLTSSDLPDYCFRDEYDSGTSPEDTADLLLEEIKVGY